MGLESDLAATRDDHGNVDLGKMTGLLVSVINGETAAPPAESSAAPAPAPNTDSATAPTIQAPAPEPAPVAAAAPAVAAPAPEPVVLAKDGVHTIPYTELVEARRMATEAKQRADELEAALAAAKTPAASTPATAPPDSKPEGTTQTIELFGDFSEEAMVKGIEKLVDIRVKAITADLDKRLGPTEAAAETAAHEAHFTTIYQAHPDADSIAESAELKAFIDKQPSFVRDGYRNVLTNGTAAQVVELFTTYKEATGVASRPSNTAATAAPAVDPVKAAEAAIAAAKLPPPTSLSDIPAGAVTAHDEAGVFAGKSPQALMASFLGRSHDDILKTLDRVI